MQVCITKPSKQGSKTEQHKVTLNKQRIIDNTLEILEKVDMVFNGA